MPRKKRKTQRGEVQAFFYYVADMKKPPKECIPWPYNPGSDGYGFIKINGQQYVATRAMCEEVHGPPPTPDHQAAHSCHNGHLGCINWSHLSWKTGKENVEQGVRRENLPRGSRHYAAKLTTRQVLEIRKSRLPTKILCQKYGLSSYQTVRNIQTGKTYRSVPGPLLSYDRGRS